MTRGRNGWLLHSPVLARSGALGSYAGKSRVCCRNPNAGYLSPVLQQVPPLRSKNFPHSRNGFGKWRYARKQLQASWLAPRGSIGSSPRLPSPPRDAAAKRQPLLQGEGRVTFACTTLRLNKGTSTYHDNLISVLYDSMTLPGIGPVRRDLDQ
jgi:hypothetical protein